MSRATLPARGSVNAYGAPVCPFRTPAAQWLSKRSKDQRHGSIPTPKLKLEFFQPGGNADTAFQAKVVPDMGSSICLFGSNFVDKYLLILDESAKAKSQKLYNASGDLMAVRGTVDMQVKYRNLMKHIDGLVTDSYLPSPLLSWHDLTQPGICKLPEGVALCNLCESEPRD